MATRCLDSELITTSQSQSSVLRSWRGTDSVLPPPVNARAMRRAQDALLKPTGRLLTPVFQRAVEFPSSAISKLIHYATGLAMVFGVKGAI